MTGLRLLCRIKYSPIFLKLAPQLTSHNNQFRAHSQRHKLQNFGFDTGKTPQNWKCICRTCNPILMVNNLSRPRLFPQLETPEFGHWFLYLLAWSQPTIVDAWLQPDFPQYSIYRFWIKLFRLTGIRIIDFLDLKWAA